MPRGKPRDPRKEQHWRHVLRRWQQSGLSVRAFCRQQRLSEPSFHAWRRILAQRDDADAGRPAAAVTFVPVHVQPEPHRESSPLELVVGRGRLLRIGAGCDPDTLRLVLAVLEGTPC